MNVLFTCIPAYGHLHAMVPLAQALAKHGHDVVFATGSSFASVVENCGFRHIPCGFDNDGQNIGITLKRQGVIPENSDLGLRVFSEILAPRMADDLIELFKKWKPDLLVRDPIEFGAYLAAEMIDVPHVSLEWAYHFGAYHNLLWGNGLAQYRALYGLAEDPELDSLYRYLSISFMPPSWVSDEYPSPSVTHWFKALLFDRSGDEKLPNWIHTLPDRPTVYATLGTTFNQAPRTFQAILDGLQNEEVNLIMTVGRNMDPSQFGSQLEHVYIERYIPQTLVLSYCDAVIGHGGYNTLLSSLTHGLPMVIMPMNKGDQLINGQRCMEVGAGILVEGMPPAPQMIRDAVGSVLREPRYRVQARRLQKEIIDLPDLTDAVRLLETLARSRKPQVNRQKII